MEEQNQVLLKKLEELEKLGNVVNPSPATLQEYTKLVSEYAIETNIQVQQQTAKAYYSQISHAEVNTDLSIQENAITFPEILQKFDKYVNKSGVTMNSPGFLAYIAGGSIPVASLGDFLTSFSNNFTSIKKLNPGGFEIEKTLIEWSAKAVGYPKNCGGNFTTGGSMANLYGIIAARERRDLKGRDYEKSVIYMTTQTHGSNEKAILVAGLKECPIRKIQMDDDFRMNSRVLEQTIKEDIGNGFTPFIVIGQAGATNTGQIDPLEEIGTICQKYNVWFHVDGAYGGYFSLCTEGKKKLKGIELSDSITLDPHKTLFMPFGIGLSLVKDLEDMKKPFNRQSQSEAQRMKENCHYLQDVCDASQDYPSATDISLELSRNFRSFKLWLCLQLYGEKIFSNILEEKLLLAKYFTQQIRKIPGIKIHQEPDLSVVCFRYSPGHFNQEEENEFNKIVNKKIQEDGRFYLSSTVLNNIFSLRISILCYNVHKKQIDETIHIINQTISNLLIEYQQRQMAALSISSLNMTAQLQ